MGLLCLLWFVTCKARVGTQLNLSLMWQFLASQVALLVKNPPANAGDKGSILGQEDPLEKEMATYSSILAWEIPWTGRQPSMGSQKSQT